MENKSYEMENKSYEELYEEYEKNKKRLIELDKIYNKNLDESLMPINQEEMDKTLRFIKAFQKKQREINQRMNELKPDEDNKQDNLIIKENSKQEESNINEEDKIINGDDEPTLELPKTKLEKELKKKISNLRIIFDGKNGLYIVKYFQNNEEKTKLYTVDKNLLNEKNEYIYNGEKYNNLDLNIVKLLGEFDKEFNTDYKDKYVTSNLENKIIYDFRKLSRVNNEYLDNKQKKKIKKQAKEYKKTHTNCDIINFSTKKAAILLGLSLAGAASGIGISTQAPKVEEQNRESTELENNKTEIKTEEKAVSEIKTEDTSKQQEVTLEVTEEKVSTEQKNEEVEEKQDVKVENENIDTKINLENIDLYSSAFDEGLGLSPRGNTDNIIGDNYTFDHFESSLIVVTYGPEVVELIKYNTTSQNDLINKCNELKNKYRESYGDDIKVSLNVNACDENGNIISKDAGWFDSVNIGLDNENVMHR